MREPVLTKEEMKEIVEESEKLFSAEEINGYRLDHLRSPYARRFTIGNVYDQDKLIKQLRTIRTRHLIKRGLKLLKNSVRNLLITGITVKVGRLPQLPGYSFLYIGDAKEILV